LQSYRRPDLHSISAREFELHGESLTDLVLEVLAQGRQIRLRARGSSMIPFINDGDQITIAPLSGRPVRVGDVIAFCHQDSNELVVHRVILCTKRNLIAKGDNEPDNPGDQVPLKDVLGTVVRIDRESLNVGFGLGAERKIIAWLSRKGWLSPLRICLAKLRKRD
jgi:signal peptidase I